MGQGEGSDEIFDNTEATALLETNPTGRNFLHENLIDSVLVGRERYSLKAW